jgi:cephalosporin hydroxylase
MIHKKCPKADLFLFEEVDFDLQSNSESSQYVAVNPYGDWIAVSAALKLMAQKFPEGPYKIVEVGTAHGHFLYSMVKYVENTLKKEVSAYGVDSQLHGYSPDFFQNKENMTFVRGNSNDKSVLNIVQDGCHFIFIDACHCRTHVTKDLETYCDRIVPGGFIGLHDTHPPFQGKSQQVRTPECSEDLTIGVVKGIEDFDMEKHGFRLVVEDQPLGEPQIGGVRIYEKV